MRTKLTSRKLFSLTYLPSTSTFRCEQLLQVCSLQVCFLQKAQQPMLRNPQL